jgi:hypothetical protein
MKGSHQAKYARAAIILAVASAAVACSRQQQANIDSAVDSGTVAIRTAFSVIDIDMGRRVDADNKITDKTDVFAATDTIYASVHTSGTATSSPVMARWTLNDTTTVEEKTQNVTTSGDAYTTFSLAKPGGLAVGKYTLHVIIDGKEVRTKDVSVR